MGEKTFSGCFRSRALIIYDPSPEADATRGTVNDSLIKH